MKTPTIYFDESGNTGQDLLNPDQNIFVLASVKFTKEQSNSLKKIFDQDEELHFVKLKNSQKGRSQIEMFLNHTLIDENNIMLSFSDKHYMTVTQIVDQLIEPILFNEGKDLYRNGMNIVFSNLLYYGGKFNAKNDDFEKMLDLFIVMFRTKSPEAIDNFYAQVEKFSNFVKFQERVYLFESLIRSKSGIKQTLENATKFTLDSTLSTFLVISDYWHKVLGTKIKVIFDESKQIDYYQDFIEYMKTLPIEKKNIGYGDATLTFPMQLESLELKSSENEINLQYADILASSITFAITNKNPKYEIFRNKIKKSKLFNLENCHSIWPSPNFTSKSLGRENDSGENLLDFLTNKKMKNGL